MQNEQIAQILEALAAKLNTTTAYLWEVLVRQANVQIIISVIDLAIGVFFVFLAVWSFKKARTNWEDERGLAFAFMCALTSIFALGCIIIALEDLPTLILNPEYWALREILNAIP